jgi:hypothetical protein
LDAILPGLLAKFILGNLGSKCFDIEVSIAMFKKNSNKIDNMRQR